jgi:hypothetical protein
MLSGIINIREPYINVWNVCYKTIQRVEVLGRSKDGIVSSQEELFSFNLQRNVPHSQYILFVR